MPKYNVCNDSRKRFFFFKKLHLNYGSGGEVHYGEENFTKTLKFSGDGNSGIQKRPHIRAEHDRHLKNGEVVHVKGCVIHKDRYDGYLSADRIKL